MRFWWRELAGWGLVLLGLLIFFVCYLFMVSTRILEVGPGVLMGIIVFRGGIHLLKVAVAARICTEAVAETVSPKRERG